MEATPGFDQFTNGIDQKPSRVTDYKLIFPIDFREIKKTVIDFETDKNYFQPSFRIVFGQIPQDINTLKREKNRISNLEHGIIGVTSGDKFYQSKILLTGEAGIGFQVKPDIHISDFLHTHTTYKEEEEKSTDLFSAFDLWSMASKGADRYWLVGRKSVLCLINLYGQRYYYQVRDAAWEMAKKYNSHKTYDQLLLDLIECVRKCEYRLYQGEGSGPYNLIS